MRPGGDTIKPGTRCFNTALARQTRRSAMGIVPEKVCTKCGVSKPPTPEFFVRNSQKRDGLSPSCKTCKSLSDKAYRENNLEKCKAKERAWYQNNLERARATRSKYQLENPEAAAERLVRWVQANPVRNLEHKAKYREANREALREKNRQYWRDRPEEGLANTRKRRSRVKSVGGVHTALDVAKQCEAQKGRCWWCGVKLKKSGKGKFHVDHVIALARGGSNGPENIVCSCAWCNQSKSAKTPLEFAGRLF